ncbi:hypothetical protein F5Y15DRAFT_116857 [Xylariaceae sp. FL0016]|nr:hypothetical protein F5Y15DRAFT_116857 [Xylariaceae sp. FL0016]
MPRCIYLSMATQTYLLVSPSCFLTVGESSRGQEDKCYTPWKATRSMDLHNLATCLAHRIPSCHAKSRDQLPDLPQMCFPRKNPSFHPRISINIKVLYVLLTVALCLLLVFTTDRVGPFEIPYLLYKPTSNWSALSTRSYLHSIIEPLESFYLGIDLSTYLR